MTNIFLVDFISFIESSFVAPDWKVDENFESGIVKTLNWSLEKYNGV